MLDWQLTIGALTMGGQPGSNDFVVSSVDGFGIPDVRNGDTPRPADDGGFFGRDFLGSRTVTAVVTITADTPAAALTDLDALLAEWQVLTTDSTVVKPLTVQRPGRAAQRWIGRPRRAAVDDSLIGSGVIVVTLEYAVADPRIYDDALSTLSTGLQQLGGGRSYNLVFPRVYGGALGDGGVVQIVNSGNRATRPVVTITGACNSPAVINDTTGEILQSTLSLVASDVLVFDFDQRLITFNGSQRWSLTSDSVWWELAPGTTQVRFTASAFVAGASMSIAWRSAHIG